LVAEEPEPGSAGLVEKEEALAPTPPRGPGLPHCEQAPVSTVAVLTSSSPLARLQKLSQDQLIDIASAEDIANNSPDLLPKSRALFEIDCSRRMIRVLTIITHKNGQTSANDRTGEWMHFPPDSKGANLTALACVVPTAPPAPAQK